MSVCRCGATVRAARDHRDRPLVLEPRPVALVLPLAFVVEPPFVDAFSIVGDPVRGRAPVGDEHAVDCFLRHDCGEST